MTVFDDVRLPELIEQGSTGGPSFNTSIVRLSNGKEARNVNWQQQRMVYDVGYGVTKREDEGEEADPSNFYAVMQFFYDRRGRARGFRFKDWTDYTADHEPLAPTADPKVFQLQKAYGSYARRITRPVNGTVVLFDHAGTVATGAVDYSTGLVTFAAAPAAVPTASFEFDVPVRFDTDVFTLTISLWNAAEVQSLAIVELPE